MTPAKARDQAKASLDPNARLVLRVVPQASPAKGEDPRDVPPAIGPPSPFVAPLPQDFTLTNGLKVHYYPRAGVPLVSLALLARHGASDEPLGKAGETSLMADLLADGAGSRDAVAFESDLERLGASFDANATSRTVVAALTVLDRNLDQALPLYADALLRPRFDAPDLAREKRVRLAQLEEESTTPARIAAKVAREAYFGVDSPLGRPVSGTAATVPTIAKADVEDAYRRSLGPAASELFVAGGVPLETLRASLEKNLGDWKGGAAAVPLTPYPAVGAKPLRVLVVDRPGAVQTNVRFLFPAPPLGAPNRAAAEAAAIALGGSFTSRLNQNLREGEGLYLRRERGLRALAGRRLPPDRRGCAERRDRARARRVPQGVHTAPRRRPHGGGDREVGPAPPGRGGPVARHPRRAPRRGRGLRVRRRAARPARSGPRRPSPPSTREA